jgi:hypothetical protein
MDLPDIYCIMITNKSRERFINVAINNFLLQTYKKKKLVILNHSNDFEVLSQERKDLLGIDKVGTDVNELHIDRDSHHFSLGALRNLALDLFVPDESVWTTFDDDDWRSPSYVTDLYRQMSNNNLDLVFLKNRLEHNMNNGYTFKSQFSNGRAFFLAKKYEKIRNLYDDVDALEDTQIAVKYRNYGKNKIGTFNNDASLYIRMIHSNNTSIYVHPEKKEIINYAPTNDYHEHEASTKEKEFVNKIIDAYF